MTQNIKARSETLSSVFRHRPGVLVIPGPTLSLVQEKSFIHPKMESQKDSIQGSSHYKLCLGRGRRNREKRPNNVWCAWLSTCGGLSAITGPGGTVQGLLMRNNPSITMSTILILANCNTGKRDQNKDYHR